MQALNVRNKHTLSCRPHKGPLLSWEENEVAAFELAPAAAAIAKSFRCPSANSPLKVLAIDEAEFMAS